MSLGLKSEIWILYLGNIEYGNIECTCQYFLLDYIAFNFYQIFPNDGLKRKISLEFPLSSWTALGMNRL